jgi:hypothetical protein
MKNNVLIVIAIVSLFVGSIIVYTMSPPENAAQNMSSETKESH